jgi:hypothetical protein
VERLSRRVGRGRTRAERACRGALAVEGLSRKVGRGDPGRRELVPPRRVCRGETARDWRSPFPFAERCCAGRLIVGAARTL